MRFQEGPLEDSNLAVKKINRTQITTVNAPILFMNLE